MRALVASVLVSSAIAHADNPTGRYDMPRPTITGRVADQLPSCGVPADAVRQEWPTLVVEYSKAGPQAIVNGEEWHPLGTVPNQFDKNPTHVTSARREELWNDFVVVVTFWRYPKTYAGGALGIVKLDADEQPVCLDTVGYAGTYRR